MANLDPRRIRVGIELGGAVRFFEDLAITVTGMKFSNPNLGECIITIANVSKDIADFILTETSPFNVNREQIRILVEAGRASSGLSVLYIGNIFRSSMSQPPDSLLTLRCLSGEFQKGKTVARSSTVTTTLSVLAAQVASDIEATLDFQATDKAVSNYTYTGSALKQLDRLEEIADIDVFLDNEVLVVKNRDVPLLGKIRILNADSGMIGVPTFTEQGARITLLFDSQTVIGGQLSVTSEQFPSLTGNYVIYRLSYQLTNRDTPFYFTAECRRIRV